MISTVGIMFLVSVFIQISQCYKGVMLVPGISLSEQMIPLQMRIKQTHPGTDVIIATYMSGLVSTVGIWQQVHQTYNAKVVSDFLARNPDGFHMVAVSQGTLVSRAMIEYYGLPVENYISLASAHMGIYGIPVVKPTLDDLGLTAVHGKIAENIYLAVYNSIAQNSLSLAGFWRDPCHFQSYLTNCALLPVLNNEVTHVNSTRFKENFSKVKNFYLFDSPDDGIIIPWQSGHFGSMECNGTVTEMKNQRVYQEDLFGLKTIDERHALFHEAIPGMSHDQFMTNTTFFDKKVVPLLN